MLSLAHGTMVSEVDLDGHIAEPVARLGRHDVARVRDPEVGKLIDLSAPFQRYN